MLWMNKELRDTEQEMLADKLEAESRKYMATVALLFLASGHIAVFDRRYVLRAITDTLDLDFLRSVPPPATTLMAPTSLEEILTIEGADF